MKLKNISTLERAMGILEGVCWSVEGRLEECLLNVIEILEAVRADEERSATDE